MHPFHLISSGFNPTEAPASPVSLPVKQRLVAAVEGLLQLLDQVGLSRHPEETLLVQTPLPDEVHTLLHQEGGQPRAKLLLILDRVFQPLTKYPWRQTRVKLPRIASG